jgi:DNA relaxase NicK
VDWLAFTLNPKPGQSLEWLFDALANVFGVPNPLDWVASAKGWNGYTKRVDLGSFGLLAFGGEAQKDTFHVELNAHACAAVSDWGSVRRWGETQGARLTRVDLAHDDFDANSFDIAVALQWLEEGKFTAGGRTPKAQLVDDLGSGSGKTLYVGSRLSGKLLRIYEKGKQLGSSSSPWVRAEVEIRSKNREIPWETVTVPQRYLAGAYPALAFLSTEQCRLRTLQRAAEISYEVMVNNLRTQGGKALSVMAQVHQGDAAAVLVQVIRQGVPKRMRGFEKVIGDLAAESKR